MNMKFRVWDKVTQRFIQRVPTGGFDTADVALDIDGELFWSTEYGGGKLDKDRYVIQAFTGLQDIHGKDIYEGDLVKFTYQTYEYEFEEDSGEVYFNEGIFYFSRELEFAANDSNFDIHSLLVIGHVVL